MATSATSRERWSELQRELSGFVDLRAIALPQVSGASEHELVFELRTQHEQIWFQGHFPGRPVLPGIVVLRSVVLCGARIFFFPIGTLLGVSQVKFLRPILPRDLLRLHLNRDPAANALSFVVKGHPPEASDPPQEASPRSVVAKGMLHFSVESI
jgi:hypothetical protein